MGGVVGFHHVQQTVGQSLPQGILVRLRLEGRLHHAEAAQARQVPFGQEQVVRTGTGRNGQAVPLAFAQPVQFRPGTDVAEVRTNPIAVHQFQDGIDLFLLGVHGHQTVLPPGREVLLPGPTPHVHEARGRVAVDLQAHDALESLGEGLEVALRMGSVVHPPIAVGIAVQFPPFPGQGLRPGGFGRGVGHVQDRRVAAGQSGRGLRGEVPLVGPVHAPQVDMRVQGTGNPENGHGPVLRLKPSGPGPVRSGSCV